MNKLGRSFRCLVCGADLMGRWMAATMVADRESLDRQMRNGMCDDCQVARLLAAEEYERASAEVRTWESLGIGDRAPGRGGRPHPAMTAALHRVQAADARCVALRMWGELRPNESAARRYGTPRGSETT